MLIQTDNFGYNNAFRCRTHVGIYNYPPHIHQFIEVVIVLDGEIDIIVNGRKERAKSGDIAVIEPFAIHGFETPRSCSIWITVFSTSYLSDFDPEIGSHYGEYSVFTPTNSLFDYVREHLIDSYDNSINCFKAAVYAIYEEYTRLVSVKEQQLNHNYILSNIFLYMNGHFKDNITLNSLAVALGYSTGYLSHSLSTLPNINFNMLLASLRIEHAKKLLLTSDLRIIDIALECGFLNERSFYRSFKKLVGITPLAYKKTKYCLGSPKM